jgi:hypothetical protein
MKGYGLTLEGQVKGCTSITTITDAKDFIYLATNQSTNDNEETSAEIIGLKAKLHGLSPRANYTDRATAACGRSECQIFADRGCHVVSVTDPHGRILGFIDMRSYFSIK